MRTRDFEKQCCLVAGGWDRQSGRLELLVIYGALGQSFSPTHFFFFNEIHIPIVKNIIQYNKKLKLPTFLTHTHTHTRQVTSTARLMCVLPDLRQSIYLSLKYANR